MCVNTQNVVPVIVARAFNSSTCEAEAGKSLNLRLAWSITLISKSKKQNFFLNEAKRAYGEVAERKSLPGASVCLGKHKNPGEITSVPIRIAIRKQANNSTKLAE